jgi:hypothetical protein
MIRGVARAERTREAEAALEMVKLPGYGARKPGQLSGGQRQRVALARALVNKPKVLLLDEPLGALDLKLREQMQEELKVLQKALGITFVFVTHDQGEALSMADRIAVFNEGRIMQTGTPEEIYRRPKTRFVADFVGSSNVLSPQLTERLAGVAEWSSLRPEDIRLGDEAGQDATVTASSFLGSATRVTLDVSGEKINVLLPSGRAGTFTGGKHPLLVGQERPAPDGSRGMSSAASAPAAAILPGRGGVGGALSDAFWRNPKLLLFRHADASAAVARHHLSRQPFRPAHPELLFDRRILRSCGARVHAQDLWELLRPPISTSLCAPSPWPRW